MDGWFGWVCAFYIKVTAILDLGRLLFCVFKGSHNDCKNHHDNGKHLKVTHKLTLLSMEFPQALRVSMVSESSDSL